MLLKLWETAENVCEQKTSTKKLNMTESKIQTGFQKKESEPLSSPTLCIVHQNQTTEILSSQ